MCQGGRGMELPKLSQSGNLRTESIHLMLTFILQKTFFASSENQSIKIPKQVDWPPMKSTEISENISVDFPGV